MFSTRTNLTLIAVAVSTSLFAQGLEDPLPDVLDSGIVVAIEPVVVIPPSSGTFPLTRINMLRMAPDGSGRLFVNDLRGEFWIVPPETGAPILFLDFGTEFPDFIDSPGFGTGFTSFAFHPEFASNGKFYTAHSEKAGSAPADFGPPEPRSITQQNVLIEWTMTHPGADLFAGTRRELLRIDQIGNFHAFQEISFNPFAQPGDSDYGLLYICQGDSGSLILGLSHFLNRVDSPYGSILRIDPTGTNSANGQYGIPPGNPFAGSHDGSVIQERYAWGFRNCHRLAWDPADPSVLYVGDIGEANIEEVNLVVAGGHYGWPQREGTFLLNPDDRTEVLPLPPSDPEPYLYPVAQFDHDDGVAIALGQVYRGSSLPSLRDKILFTDIRRGDFFFIEAAAASQGILQPVQRFKVALGETVLSEFVDVFTHSRADLRFAEPVQGEIYLITKTDGAIWRLFEVGGTSSWKITFHKLNETTGRLSFPTLPTACYQIQSSPDGIQWTNYGRPLISSQGDPEHVDVPLTADRLLFRVQRTYPCTGR